MRDHATVIAEIRGRDKHGHRYISWTVKALKEQWSQSTERECPDFYVIRTVTLLEVLTRRSIATLIDHGDQYVDRAVDLSKHIKLDLSLVYAAHGHMITIGDIVAYNLPLSSFGQIIGYFETLLSRSVRPLLEQAVDRWTVEVGQNIAEPIRAAGNTEYAAELENAAEGPIIRDFDATAANLTRLFEIRHILCHELPAKPIYSVDEIKDFLENAFRFAKALEEVLSFEMFGLVPLTQSEMNIAAGERLRKAQGEMAAAVEELRAELGPDHDLLASFDNTQEKWAHYCDAQCEFHAQPYRGGTIRPLIWAGEAQRLTEARTEDIRMLLNKDE